MKRLLIIAAMLPLAGCVSPQWTHTPIQIQLESNVPGVKVTVTDQQRGTYEVCAPPCVADVRDSFRFMSRYVFRASKAGYLDSVVVVDERHIFDARPPVDVVRFQLTEQK